ncbi:fibrinogen-like YCDxxxxGGGW domain-containing protein [Aeromicrobium sp.]|uniref:fibrinogen-like YCDxxxxGGGW domain-containing protein n=1 Tax=Aeromicrobium sp. TaxID=1871063 RepID=UPI0040338BE7
MRTKTSLAALAAAFAVVVTGLTGVVPAAQAATVVPDGSSQASAAASCWEVKQVKPSATDGVYWLLTPQLRTPTQFYCDMTTDGGGWVLVGRGRDGWNWDGDAQGTPAQIASTVSGQAAFAPKKLSTATVDALLGGGRVDALTDGIRLKRATNVEGTAWQDVRMRVRSLASWSWAFGAGHPLTSASFDGQSYSGSTSRDFGTTSTFSSARLQRVWTFESSANGWVRGFNYGSGVNGSTASTSNLYATATGNATPFTQVLIRPRLRQADLSFDSIPDSGTGAVTALPVARSGSLAQPWGVTGTGAGGTGELATEVQAFAQIGNVMYVGGNFTTVRNQAGSQSVAQSYLAAFDATTGEWISSFRPTFDNQVRSLAALPDGRLAVGGEFTTVNGQGRTGLTVLDATGALSSSWTTVVENRGTSAKVSVRGLDVSGGRLYVGGVFTHLVRGTNAAYARNAGRIDLSTGNGDAGWNPNFNGSVAALDVSDDGARAYFAGYMTASGATTVKKGVAISTAAGAAVTTPAWNPTYSTGGASYQQAVKQVGGKVWLGGSQHSMFSYDTTDFALKDTGITKAGGDLQAITGGLGDKVAYGGCHCGDWNYSGTTNYDNFNPGTTSVQWTQAGKISLLGAWDNTTGAFVTTFAPQWKSRGGFGVWAATVAKDGTLWAGGSIQTSVKDGGGNQFSGGFARFAQRPATAPSAPSEAKAVVEGSSATVSWKAGSTNGVTYEVLRNDRVVATTTSTTVSVPGSTSADRFFVRASDGQGNWSASTVVVQPAQSATVLADGATWSYYFDNTAPVATDWKGDSFDASGWRSGPAPLGWGSGPIATNIDVAAGSTRALTSYYRRTFDVADVGAFTRYRLTTRADDGVVVYVNGTEVARVNLPTGTVGPNTYATAAPTTTSATNNPVSVDIPLSALRNGSNVITAEVHSNYRSTPTTSFDANVVASR